MLAKMLADQYSGCRTVTFSDMDVIPDFVLRTIPKKYISRYLVLPFKLDAGGLLTATMKPTDRNTMDDLRFITGYSVIPHLATEYHMLQAILNYYNISGDYRNIYRKNEIEEFQEEDVEFVEREDLLLHWEIRVLRRDMKRPPLSGWISLLMTKAQRSRIISLQCYRRGEPRKSALC